MDMGIDLGLNVKLPPQNINYTEGAAQFVDFLKRLRRVQGFDVDWIAQMKEHGPKISLWHQPDAYVQMFQERYKDQTDGFNIWAWEESQSREHPKLYDFDYDWQNQPLLTVDMLSGEIHHHHPDYGLQPQQFIDMIDVITQWKRPQHLRFGPLIYMRDHHPLDRAREGIGWMGWVPFALTPSDVPEAALVREMNGGTLIVTQMEFWQAWPAHPDYSKTAIERAQEVEVRLNLLGVLPTIVELQRGDWGL